MGRVEEYKNYIKRWGINWPIKNYIEDLKLEITELKDEIKQLNEYIKKLKMEKYL